MKKMYTLLVLMAVPVLLSAQPEIPVEEWTGRTILFIGAHPDDDSCCHGTLAMLQDHGNEVYVLMLTTGNVGTKDPDMTRQRLAKIRYREEVSALAELGIPEDHYINLGYTDGMVQYVPEKEVVRDLVRWIRKLRPTTLIMFSPGWGYQQWYKTDHRAAAYLAADAARAAEWRLLFQGQIIQGLEAYRVEDYLLFNELGKATNTWVNISNYVDEKVQSISKYISQFTSGWTNYRGPDLEDLPGNEGEEFLKGIRERVSTSNLRNGEPHETFRYYKGMPDGIGSRPDKYFNVMGGAPDE